jgi:zinc D-Ala-D-Ala carboxypeptidase
MIVLRRGDRRLRVWCFATPMAVVALLAGCAGEKAEETIIAAASEPEQASPGFVLPSSTAPSEPPPDTPADPAQVSSSPPSTEPAKPAPGHIPLDFLIGRVDPAKDPAFARIPAKYISGSRVWGHKDAVEAFIRMAEAAAANGYKLRIVSAFRSFEDQRQIWDDKWTGKTLVDRKKLPNSHPDPKARAVKILEFSSMPGTSRHHWGTDFDFNSLNNSYFKSGEGKRTYDWLTQHAAEYGFCQPYTVKGEDRPTGYEEEKWHWSYMPVASWYLQQYPVDVGYERLTGFEGAAAAKDIDVIASYVQGINPDCK